MVMVVMMLLLLLVVVVVGGHDGNHSYFLQHLYSVFPILNTKCSTWFLFLMIIITHRIHVWYICQHDWGILMGSMLPY